MTFSVFLDIFYPPNFDRFQANGLFQQPRLVTTNCRLQRQKAVKHESANDPNGTVQHPTTTQSPPPNRRGSVNACAKCPTKSYFSSLRRCGS